MSKLTEEQFEQIIKEYELIDAYDDQQTFLLHICENFNVPLRSIIASLSKRHVYKSKPKLRKNPSTKIIEVPGIGKISISKDRIIADLEDRLGIGPGELYSLRAATKESLVALIGGIKAVEDGIVSPEMESFYDKFESTNGSPS